MTEKVSVVSTSYSPAVIEAPIAASDAIKEASRRRAANIKALDLKIQEILEPVLEKNSTGDPELRVFLEARLSLLANIRQNHLSEVETGLFDRVLQRYINTLNRVLKGSALKITGENHPLRVETLTIPPASSADRAHPLPRSPVPLSNCQSVYNALDVPILEEDDSTDNRYSRSLIDFLEASLAHKPKLSVSTQKLSNLYASYKNSRTAYASTSSRSLIQPELDQIDKLKHHSDLPRLLAKLTQAGVSLPIAVQVERDNRNPLFLGWKIHLKSNTAFYEPNKIKDFFHNVIGKSASESQQAIDQVDQMMKKWFFGGLTASFTDTTTSLQSPFDFAEFWRTSGGGVGQPFRVSDQLKRCLSALVNEYSIDQWKKFLQACTFQSFSPYLPVTEPSGTNQNTLQRSNPKVAFEFLKKEMPEAVYQWFLEQKLSTALNSRAKDIISQVRSVFKARIQRSSWLSAASAQKAITLIDELQVVILPGELSDDFMGLDIEPNDIVRNLKRLSAYRVQKQFKDTHPSNVDFNLKAEMPWEDNASYIAQENKVLIQPGIVLKMLGQNPDLEEAYGTFGYLIAHEMLHGLESTFWESEGQPFEMPPASWLNAGESNYYREMLSRQAQHYSDFIAARHNRFPLTQRMVNEDVADLGAVLFSLDALKQVSAQRPIDEKRFFSAYATLNRRPYLIEDQEYYPVWSYRVDGVLSNVQRFAQVYGCQNGDPMVRLSNEKINLW